LGLRVRVGNRARIRARAGAKVWVRVTSSPGNIARVARRPRPRVGWSNASNGGGAVAAAAASLLALRELVDGILAQCLSTARQLDRLQMHADLSKVRLKRVSRRAASSALWRVGCGRTKSARLGLRPAWRTAATTTSATPQRPMTKLRCACQAYGMARVTVERWAVAS
jgi:hypothetical protein